MKDETITDEKKDFYLVERLDDKTILRLGKNFLFEAIDRAIHNPLLDVFVQLILKIVGLNKVVVHADCGEIIPFINTHRSL